jgi:hypothetical protein
MIGEGTFHRDAANAPSGGPFLAKIIRAKPAMDVAPFLIHGMVLAIVAVRLHGSEDKHACARCHFATSGVSAIASCLPCSRA